MLPVMSDLTERYIEQGKLQHHEYEQIPWVLAWTSAASDPGLLALFVGCANWGVNWEGRNPRYATPTDPAGNDWKGPRRGSGKHLNDGGGGAVKHGRPYGGLCIPHADSSFLRRAYAQWGAPPGIPTELLESASFDQILDRESGRYRDAFLEWSTPLLNRKDFILWTVKTWKERYWNPARETNDDLATAVLNSRIRNSASGVGRRLAGLSWTEQAKGYYDYKLKRSERAAERSKRQVGFCDRVRVILAHAGGIEPL